MHSTFVSGCVEIVMCRRALANYAGRIGASVLTLSAMAANLPPDFSESIITAAITEGTALEFAPDGKLFILEQDGPVRIYQGAGPGPWLDIATTGDFFAADPLDVHVSNDRGLFGIAFDPDYVTNRFIYFYYTTSLPTVHNRIVRVMANADGTQVVPGSRVALMDLDNASSTLHYGGAMHFGTDHKLYIAVGDHGNHLNPQSINNRFGKMLRLNPDPLDPIPADNPTSIAGIAGTTSGVNRAIWAAGLRNPFTFAINKINGKIFINDVGELSYEEINFGVAGANYGWADTEGPFDPLLFPNFTQPIVAYPRPGSGNPNHPAGNSYQGRAITGGDFYTPATITFSSDFVNDYFFADFVDGWIRRYDDVEDRVIDFATGIGGPIDLRVGPDGALYYLARNAQGFENGRVYRIQSTLPPCPADLTDGGALNLPDGTVNVFDLFKLLSNWNTAGAGATLAEPLGVVNVADLFMLLAAWGDC